MDVNILVSKKVCSGCNQLGLDRHPLRYDCVSGSKRDQTGEPLKCGGESKVRCCTVCKNTSVGLLGKLSNRSLGIEDSQAKADQCFQCGRELRYMYNAGGGVVLHETSSVRLHSLVDTCMLEDLTRLFISPRPARLPRQRVVHKLRWRVNDQSGEFASTPK
jgi:hypothetical protein